MERTGETEVLGEESTYKTWKIQTKPTVFIMSPSPPFFFSCTGTVSHQDGKRQHTDNIFLPLGLEFF